MKRLHVRHKILVYTLLILLALAILFPIYYMVLISLKQPRDIYRDLSLLPIGAVLSNYTELLTTRAFLANIRNSITLAGSSTIIAVLMSFLASYSLVRLKYRYRDLLTNIILLAYFIPGSLLFIPLSSIIAQLHLTNSLPGLILVDLSFATPFSTWLLMGFMRGIPIDLDEQAMIDGATHRQVLLYIIFPLTVPGLVAINIFTFAGVWNELLFALVFITSPDKQPVPVALQNLIVGDVFRWGLIMAGSVIATTPIVILYYLTQRFITQGLTAGAIKG